LKFTSLPVSESTDLERLDRQAAHLGNVVRCRRFAPHCAGGDVDGVRSTLECTLSVAMG
jgi:hypothetical protein